jgi:hypothetical protein
MFGDGTSDEASVNTELLLDFTISASIGNSTALFEHPAYFQETKKK